MTHQLVWEKADVLSPEFRPEDFKLNDKFMTSAPQNGTSQRTKLVLKCLRDLGAAFTQTQTSEEAFDRI